MAEPTAEMMRTRHDVLRPVFTTLEQQGRKRAWLAAQLHLGRPTLSQYERGKRRVPPDFIERASQLLGIPTALVPLAGLDALVVQQPRKAATPKPRKWQARNA